MIALDVPEQELISRLLTKRKTTGRCPDDLMQIVIVNRIKVSHYGYGCLYRLNNLSVNGIGTVDEVTDRLYHVID